MSIGTSFSMRAALVSVGLLVGALGRPALAEEEATPSNIPPFPLAGSPVSTWASEPVTLSGSATDLNSGDRISVVGWTWGTDPGTDPAAQCTFGSPQEFTTTVTCSHEGVYTVQLAVTDHRSPPTSASTKVHVRNPSNVTLCNLKRYSPTSAQRLCGYVTKGADQSNIVSAWFTVDGGEPIPVTPTGTSGMVDITVPLAEGDHMIRLYARNALGRVIMRSQPVTVDLTPPRLVVVSPTTNDVLSSTVVDVTSSVTDASATVVTQWIRTTNVPAGTHTVTHTIDLVNRGWQTALVRATDAAGHTTEVRLKVYVK